MKKITTVFTVLLFIAFAASAQKKGKPASAFKPFTKAASEEFKDFEEINQIYLNNENKFVLTTFKRDTVYSSKNSRPSREIIVTVIPVTIRPHEKGKLMEWEGDSVAWVLFDTEEKQGLKLPFVPTGSGSGNTGNNMALRIDKICGYQINGDAILCKATDKKVTLGSVETEDLATYTFVGDRPHIVYKPIFKEKTKIVKVKSRGYKVK